MTTQSTESAKNSLATQCEFQFTKAIIEEPNGKVCGKKGRGLPAAEKFPLDWETKDPAWQATAAEMEAWARKGVGNR